MTITTESLEQRIEKAVEALVREHLAACEAASAKAVRAAFRRATAPATTKEAARTTSRGRRARSRRRTPEEIAALGERLYAAICRDPGETMAVLAPKLGATPRELQRPSTLLRRAGRVRSVGQRHATRYFPIGE